MTKEEIYDKIREWEIDYGESFFDYFSHHVHIPFYNGFLLGKGHVEFANDVANDTMREFGKRERFTVLDMNEVGDIYPEYDENEKFSEENYEKNLRLFAEFISLTDVYQARFANFLAENC